MRIRIIYKAVHFNLFDSLRLIFSSVQSERLQSTHFKDIQ